MKYTLSRRRDSLSRKLTLFAGGLAALAAVNGLGEEAKPAAAPAAAPAAGNPASDATKNVNAAFLKELDFNDRKDFEDARRGFIAPLPKEPITTSKGLPVFNRGAFSFLETQPVPGTAAAPATAGAAVSAATAGTPAPAASPGMGAPDTVNPSLWRQSQLNYIGGLFKVTDGIYQVRGLDLSNITIVEGKTGLIVMDPLISNEVASAAMNLYFQHRPKKPVKALIYSHSHGDHYGGALGVIEEKDVKAKKVMIIAPEHFLEHAASENLIAGNAMLRRGTYMYGNLVSPGPTGVVGSGLGLAGSTGTTSLIPPTRTIKKTGETLTIDGVKMVFQMTPGTEAPAEMNTFFPAKSALWMAENATHNMHNLYTLRGAQVRDANGWAKYLDQSIALYGKQAEVAFAAHHWPTWGNGRVVQFLRQQRDIYRFMHDQTLRLANQGYTMLEIANMIQPPKELAKVWSTRGYYGSLSHNVRAVYNKYLGYFSGNPADLNPLPPKEVAAKYVIMMGGEENILKMAQGSYDAGEYRWVAELLKHVVFNNPKNAPARELQAKAFEQLGYQSESGPWRNFYLAGAQELRTGVKELPSPSLITQDTLAALSPEMLFEFMGVHVNSGKAEGKVIGIEMNLTDMKKKYEVRLENSVLNAREGKTGLPVYAQMSMTKKDLAQLVSQLATAPAPGVEAAAGTAGAASPETAGAAGGTATAATGAALASGRRMDLSQVKISGDPSQVRELFATMDKFPFWFNIIEPRPDQPAATPVTPQEQPALAE